MWGKKLPDSFMFESHVLPWAWLVSGFPSTANCCHVMLSYYCHVVISCSHGLGGVGWLQDTCYDDILHDIKVVSHECCIMSCQMSYEIFMTCHIISHVTCHGTGTSLNMEHLCYHAMSWCHVVVLCHNMQLVHVMSFYELLCHVMTCHFVTSWCHAMLR